MGIIDDREISFMLACLIRCNGVQAKAAKLMGISINTFRGRSRKYPEVKELIDSYNILKEKKQTKPRIEVGPKNIVTKRMLENAIKEFGYDLYFLSGYFFIRAVEVQKLIKEYNIQIEIK